jgi:protein-S-isoprenylcysteine O-methyltransferase Ste14
VGRHFSVLPDAYREGTMAALIYGAISYVVFLVTFLYAIGFVGNIVVPKSIDVGGGGAFTFSALIVDVILLGLFAIQHSIMARPFHPVDQTEVQTRKPDSTVKSTIVRPANG